MEKLTVVVNSKSGLHARPATMLAGTTKKFSSDIVVRKDNKSVNGKSVMGILSIAASEGDTLEIVVEGQDELEAVSAIRELFEIKLRHA